MFAKCCPRMKTTNLTKVGAVACMIALASCAQPPATTSVPMSATGPPDSSLSARVFQEVNSYRRSHGARDLPRHPGLDRLAQEHCEFLRQNRGKFGLYGKNVSHFGFEGRTLAARERYRMQNLGENVVAANSSGSGTASMLVQQWAASKSHAYNMRSSWTHSGIGVVVDDDGMVFSTQLFGVISNSQMDLTDRFRRL